MKLSAIFVLMLLFCGFARSQNVDTTKISSLNDTIKPRLDKKKLYSRPRTASIMSICLPGLGQAYNRKFWKVPIIYAGLGGFGYMFYFYNSQYNDISKNLRYENDDDPTTVNASRYSSSQLQELKIKPHKMRDWSIIGLSAIYILNIIDANVDAHLKTFDVSDDLSLKIGPWQSMDMTQPHARIVTGLSLKLNFK
jgi:hypothetical protein